MSRSRRLGSSILDGEPVDLESTNDAAARGISIIHQELNLFPNLSVRDNIFIGRELRTRAGAIDYARGAGDHRTADGAARGDRFDPHAGRGPSARPAADRRDRRALAADARILIMDEPTSALSATEVEVLFRVIRELTAHGVAIVYISHHLEEALEIADHAVVLRDGELVATAKRPTSTCRWIVRKMVGREADYDFRDEPRDLATWCCRIRGRHRADAGHRPGRGRRCVAGRAARARSSASTG